MCKKKTNFTVYEPGSRQKLSFFKTIYVMAVNINNSKEFIAQIFIRDYIAAHKKSFLGFAWVGLAPLFSVVSWLFLNATGILNAGDTIVPYPIYILFGTMFWALFWGAYQSSASTLTIAQGYILQARYSHEALLVKQTLEQFANFFITLIINIAILFAFGLVPSWKIVFIPLMILPLVFLGAGMGLILSPLSVIAGEFKRICDVCIGLVLFITPVMYTADAATPACGRFFYYNPLTHLINACRSMILYGTFENIREYIISSVIAFVFLLLSWRFFYVSEERVIEKMY